jgi:dTDP-4-dehydrorhamnose reductase
MKVLVLGAGGMLGHRVVRALKGLDVIAPTRDEYEAPNSLAKFKLGQEDYVVNCIGAIPQKGHDAASMKHLNTHFPHLLSMEGLRVIQIATDCAFSGAKGNYTETDNRDATDDYGTSKINGEVIQFMNLRTSIIGPELSGKKSLFEWVRNQPTGARIHGYANHYWNGITTDAFGAIVRSVIELDRWGHGIQHVIPADQVSKYKLVKMIATKVGRTDLEIIPTITSPINRTLDTIAPETNTGLWRIAGYYQPPTIQELITGMALD